MEKGVSYTKRRDLLTFKLKIYQDEPTLDLSNTSTWRPDTFMHPGTQAESLTTRKPISYVAKDNEGLRWKWGDDGRRMGVQ
jgi:hypothetical protein